MAEIASWNGHSFTVSPNLIRGFTGLTITGSSETEDMESDGQKYVSRKNSKPSEISLTAELNALTGCDVKGEAMAFVNEARSGATGYFYMSGKKLMACQLMLTDASISETTIAVNGTWVRCKVKLTMKQCGKYEDGGTPSAASSASYGDSGGSSGSSSSKKTSTKTKTPTVTGGSDVDAVSMAAPKSSALKAAASVISATKNVSSALKSAVSVVSAARNISSATKGASTASKVSSGTSKATALKKK